jgi:hypothetical protein
MPAVGSDRFCLKGRGCGLIWGYEDKSCNALAVTGVTTIHPERTFLDKILILHGMTFYYDARGALRGVTFG